MAISAQAVKELREKTGAGMMDCKKALEATMGDLEKAFDWLRENGIAKSAKKADRIAAEGLTTVATDGNKAAIVEVNSETDFVAKNEEFKQLVKTVAETIVKSTAKTVDEALELDVNGTPLKTVIAEKSGKIGEKLSLRRFEIVEKADDEVFGVYSHMEGKITALVKIAGAEAEKAKHIAMHVAAQAPAYVDEDGIPADVKEREEKVAKAEMENDEKIAAKPDQVKAGILKGKLKKVFAEMCLVDQEFIMTPKETVQKYLGKGKVTSMTRYLVGEGMEKRSENFAEEVAAQMK